MDMEIREFRAWEKWVAEEGRCQAMTAKGRQCRNKCHLYGNEVSGYDDFETVEFVWGDTDRCRVHIEQGMLVKALNEYCDEALLEQLEADDDIE